MVIALDIGATRIKGALLDENRTRLTEMRYPTRRGDGPAVVLRRMCQVAAWLADSAAGRVHAAGVAVCGTVDEAGLVTSVNLGWAGIDVGTVLQRHLGIPVAVLNDARAGAIGEGEAGVAAGLRDYLYVSLGTGIGAAIVRDGTVLPGAHSHAGELGHIVVDPAGPLCACGAHGCLQTYMSAAALEARWLERSGGVLEAREIVALAVCGNPAAASLWFEAVGALAAGLLTAISLIDPGTIVFGGGLAGAGRHLVEPLAHSIDGQARSFHTPADLRLATLGDWSNCFGAAAQARHLAAPLLAGAA
jgi:glucokinase